MILALITDLAMLMKGFLALKGEQISLKPELDISKIPARGLRFAEERTRDLNQSLTPFRIKLITLNRNSETRHSSRSEIFGKRSSQDDELI